MAHRVVIVGGGFAGLDAAKVLGGQPVDVTVVDRRNFHLFQPLLYQVATGTLAPGDIAAPIRSVLKDHKNIRVVLGEVKDVDVRAHTLELEDGDRIPYDSLIIGTGAENFYFGNDRWERVAPGLKTIEDATRVRHKILYAFEAAERETDPQRRNEWLTFVVVGAGPTGVELAGAMAETARHVLKDEFRSIRPEEAKILLLDGSPRVLPPFPPDLSEKAEKSLIRLGVRPINNVRVIEVGERGVTVKRANNVEVIPTRTVIWAAGVRGSAIARVLEERTGATLDRGGRIPVTDHLTIAGFPEIYVVGDVAAAKQRNGELVPGVAPAAMQMGRYAAKEILRKVKGQPSKPFHYINKGNLAVIGRHSAVAEIAKLRFAGPLAWFIWLFIHLMYIVTFENRLIIFLRWGVSYLTWNRMARLITGRPTTGTEECEPITVEQRQAEAIK